MNFAAIGRQTLDEATGRAHRTDPVLARTGGPAGNARLTAWTGLLLLLLFGAELLTLSDVRGLINWHVIIGIILIPPALLKTATTGWRIVRYYTGGAPYRTAGPPSWPMRILGPLVVASTLAVLGSGVVLVLIGAAASRRALFTGLGYSVDATTLHKAAFVGWAVVTGAHTLGRLVPALRLTFWPSPERPAVPGQRWRVVVLVSAAILAVVAATAVMSTVDMSNWKKFPHRAPTSGVPRR